MTLEEKARAYDKVSKEVKDFFEGKQKMYSDVNQTLEYLFPELKESEDERIRKAIIGHIKGLHFYDAYYGVTPDEMLAWLKKQGDKPQVDDFDTELTVSEDDRRVRKELMKFLVGNRIICNDLGGINIDKTLTWLEKQVPKPKWTEEDEELYQNALDVFEAFDYNLESSEGCEKLYDWLKSLKQRMI